MFATSVMTCPSRAANYLPRTLDSLHAGGFVDSTIISDGGMPEGMLASQPVRCSHVRLGIVPTFRRALQSVVGVSRYGIVFQDDVSLREPDGFMGRLGESLPAQQGIFSLYASPQRVVPGDWNGWTVLEDDGQYTYNVGACGLAFDTETARRVLSDRPFPRVDRLGSQLALWARRNDVPFYIHSPGLLTHIGDVSCDDRKPFKHGDSK